MSIHTYISFIDADRFACFGITLKKFVGYMGRQSVFLYWSDLHISKLQLVSEPGSEMKSMKNIK